MRAGQAIFRQGDRGDAFYVVRQGEVVVETEHPRDRRDGMLRTLRRGESFGELGLLVDAPVRHGPGRRARSNCSRWTEPTFDRLLADAIDAPSSRPTMQAMAELRRIPRSDT